MEYSIGIPARDSWYYLILAIQEPLPGRKTGAR